MVTLASQNGKQRSARSSERCYEILRRMLVCGQVPPGTRLREIEWSEKLGVQRAALREAMVLLVHDGLLIRRSSGGFFTLSLNEIDVAGVVDARIVLEVGGVKLTCQKKLPASAFEAVETACDLIERCHEAGMASGFSEADFLFHQRLLELSGNSSLIQMFSHSAQLIFVVTPMSGEQQRQAELNTIREHRNILKFVRAGDEEQAVTSLEAHLKATKAGLKSV